MDDAKLGRELKSESKEITKDIRLNFKKLKYITYKCKSLAIYKKKYRIGER